VGAPLQIPISTLSKSSTAIFEELKLQLHLVSALLFSIAAIL
jgi:hypothetical protein